VGEEGPLDSAGLARARTLFARAIETPGGLRLQTIHAFCASILRRFPLEAGVSPAFTEIDEGVQTALFARILDEMADGSDAAVVDGLADRSGAELTALAREATRWREAFARPMSLQAARTAFGVPAEESAADVVADVFNATTCDLLRRIRDACVEGSARDVAYCEALSALHLTEPTADDLRILEGAFLTGSDATAPFTPKLGKVPTKRTRALLGTDGAIDALMERVAAARARRLAHAAAERSAALHAFAGVFLPRYEEAKAARGWVDYDDLILKVRRLIDDPGVADWVLYRLDGGIDNILVDEAQDTSPAQWQIIARLAAEFAAGRGARGDTRRTLFVVGDFKQSIYSFQGANPAEFERMAEHFERRLPERLTRLTLEHSFRSARAILETVDRASRNLAGVGPCVTHRPFHAALPGRVDLWPIEPRAGTPEPGDWFRPVDALAPNAAHVVLARKLAHWLRERIDAADPIPDREGTLRPLRPGDVLILVQRRNETFHEIIRALKVAGLPVAGADRLTLTEELSVRDLLALLAFLALPEDDLSLAAALRSPLFGWTEAELYDLAHGRDSYLWAALRRHRDHAETRATLWDLLERADFDRPHELLERVLTRHGGRRRLLARLGAEAEDGIDELLNKALAYEQTEVPSLTGFLTWIEAEDVEVRRQPDAAGDRVRVMTVHGAKGLEAPMVVLPDTLRQEGRLQDEIVVTERGTPLWRTGKDEEPPQLAAARARRESAEAEERERLLYVAMTRAQTWLVVCGAGEDRGQGGVWHATIAAAMGEDAAPCAFPTGVGRRLERGDWTAAVSAPKPPGTTREAVVPGGAPPPPPRQAPLRASDLGGAKALPGEGLEEAEAKARGTALHLLLEAFPGTAPGERAALAETLLGAPRPDLVAEASTVVDAAHLRHLFGPDALAEVDVAANMPELGGAPLHGTIDRLIVGDRRVTCVDFKTNRTLPATPEAVPDGLLRQMGAYASALRQIYPDREVATAILWTREARLMPLPERLVAGALLDASPALS
jgi:ATP-dependent helicase/nuclease subunit A